MKHMNYNIPAMAMLAAALIGASSCHRKAERPEAQTPEIDVAAVTTDSVTIHKVYPGYLTANRSVDLVARVNGYLRSKNYTSGDFVRQGTVLFTIESTQYADAVRQAKADLESAQSGYAYTSKNYAAMEKALESDAVSRMEVLQSKNAMEADLAAIESAKSRLQSAQTTLSYCTIRAPFDGHVSKANYDNGSYLSGAGAPVVLATIYDDAVVSVNFNIDEKELAEIKANRADPGMAVDMKRIPITFDSPLPHTYTADLSYVAPAIDKSTGSMQMQADIKNTYGELRSGMYCKIHMPNGVMQKARLVKDASIGSDQLGKYVYVVNDSNRVVYTPIEVGELVQDTLRVVTKGLKPGERYVTKALLKVRDGMTVKPRLTR